jgi:hypothetical protein
MGMNMIFNILLGELNQNQIPDTTYWPSGVKVASIVVLGDGSKLKPHRCKRKSLDWSLNPYIIHKQNNVQASLESNQQDIEPALRR